MIHFGGAKRGGKMFVKGSFFITINLVHYPTAVINTTMVFMAHCMSLIQNPVVSTNTQDLIAERKKITCLFAESEWKHAYWQLTQHDLPQYIILQDVLLQLPQFSCHTDWRMFFNTHRGHQLVQGLLTTGWQGVKCFHLLIHTGNPSLQSFPAQIYFEGGLKSSDVLKSLINHDYHNIQIKKRKIAF